MIMSTWPKTQNKLTAHRVETSNGFSKIIADNDFERFCTVFRIFVKV